MTCQLTVIASGGKYTVKCSVHGVVGAIPHHAYASETLKSLRILVALIQRHCTAYCTEEDKAAVAIAELVGQRLQSDKPDVYVAGRGACLSSDLVLV